MTPTLFLWGQVGGSEVGQDQCGDPGIFVVCCCQFWVCSVRFACLFLRVWIWWVVICKEYGILRELVVFCFLGLFTRTLRPGGGLVVCGDGLLIVFNQVGMVCSLLRLFYTLRLV